ncbi:hypothetical protein BDL97_03G041200 [Sphagnum fallax]|jgi:hypothetical protein|nr:hypothetical protein BDL97_03G041200 [Sphagnum fallax]
MDNLYQKVSRQLSRRKYERLDNSQGGLHFVVEKKPVRINFARLGVHGIRQRRSDNRRHGHTRLRLQRRRNLPNQVVKVPVRMLIGLRDAYKNLMLFFASPNRVKRIDGLNPHHAALASSFLSTTVSSSKDVVDQAFFKEALRRSIANGKSISSLISQQTNT